MTYLAYSIEISREKITTTWDLEFSAAPYIEIAIRVYTPRKNNPTNSPFSNKCLNHL
jgi:hypothetical protein